MTTPNELQKDIIKRIQSGSIELLMIELDATPLDDTNTRKEILSDLNHRVKYIQNQIKTLTEMNDKEILKNAMF